MGKPRKTREVLEPVGDYIILEKTAKCSIKGCNEYGTKMMCTLPMCNNHFEKARD
jgi:hypothetical protein